MNPGAWEGKGRGGAGGAERTQWIVRSAADAIVDPGGARALERKLCAFAIPDPSEPTRSLRKTTSPSSSSSEGIAWGDSTVPSNFGMIGGRGASTAFRARFAGDMSRFVRAFSVNRTWGDVTVGDFPCTHAPGVVGFSGVVESKRAVRVAASFCDPTFILTGVITALAFRCRGAAVAVGGVVVAVRAVVRVGVFGPAGPVRAPVGDARCVVDDRGGLLGWGPSTSSFHVPEPHISLRYRRLDPSISVSELTHVWNV